MSGFSLFRSGKSDGDLEAMISTPLLSAERQSIPGCFVDVLERIKRRESPPAFQASDCLLKLLIS